MPDKERDYHGVVAALRRRQGGAKPEPLSKTFQVTTDVEDVENMNAETHEMVCQDGFIYVDSPTGSLVRPCPTCVREKNLAKLTERIRSSGIGPRYLTLEWADLEMVDPLPRLRDACERIGQIIDSGECALFHGRPGAGKTQAAVLLVKAAIRAGRTAAMHNLGRLAMEVRDGYDREGGLSEAAAVRELSDVDLLVLDDIGAGETNAAKVEQRLLYLVTEARQNAAKPTIVTTNLAPKTLGETIGVRIVNRLQPLTTIAFSHGRNFRRRTDSEGGAW